MTPPSPHAEQRIARAWEDILDALGYNVTGDPHFVGTPERVARFLVGWDTHRAEPPPLTTFPANGYDELVLVGGIAFSSMCSHHGLVFSGVAAVGYIPRPDGQIVGLSKLARVVEHFAHRYQTQEQIGVDVAGYLEEHLHPLGVGVVLRAEHHCMSIRGVEKPGHTTTTSVMRGVFRDKPEARAELLSLVAAGR